MQIEIETEHDMGSNAFRNEKVESEWFDEATIYFSDIVGFTALSSSSSPNQVFAFLVQQNIESLLFNLVALTVQE